jgi:hypothetical protein
MRPYLELRKAAVWLQVQDEGSVAAHRLQTALSNDGHFSTATVPKLFEIKSYFRVCALVHQCQAKTHIS